MLKDKAPKRGAFDYLLHGNSFHADPPQPPRREPPGRIRIEIEIMDSRNKVREARKAHRASWVFLITMLGIFLTLVLAAHGIP